MSNELGNLITKHFPLLGECMKGSKVAHKGPTVVTLQWEQTDEDRQEVNAVPRCSHCWMPDYSAASAAAALLDNFKRDRHEEHNTKKD